MSDSAPRRRLSLPPSGPRASQPDPAPPRPPRPAGPRPAGRFTVRAPEAGAAAARTAPAGREARAPSRAGPGAARTSAPMGAPAGGHRGDAPSGTSRLNKRMAELGLCSRREADDWIASGWVRVNGQVAAMGLQVAPTDRIEVDPAARGQQERQATILLHKPMGYVSGQAEDGHTPAVALINPRTHWREDPSRQRFSPPQLCGLAPCGRLDIDSVGLLVLTQDGRVARHLIGEDSEVEKEYLVRVHYGDIATDVQSAFPAGQLARLCHGLSLDGQALKPAKVEWQNPEQLRFVLKEGKKRQIRRMCELVGLKVVGLKRIRIGRVVLGNLPVGQWRYLGPNERF
ncbi:pseudouridine synthase [Paracidovorax citrulli]|uniref:pseudouridine synthase n=1 Tax=Paracidovorax citrulli TaxID=80869 RepID=UPI0008856821|nr:pseudouridine synthase [Paracidovorax citrulli]WIY35279.1 pseudouridine synthase [Paracidovorax citrulli]SDL40698.1 23S rRNA pseudouridine2604 synthase [Paracidovorax citrulli]